MVASYGDILQYDWTIDLLHCLIGNREVEMWLRNNHNMLDNCNERQDRETGPPEEAECRVLTHSTVSQRCQHPDPATCSHTPKWLLETADS
jgi:hypothetical protein